MLYVVRQKALGSEESENTSFGNALKDLEYFCDPPYTLISKVYNPSHLLIVGAKVGRTVGETVQPEFGSGTNETFVYCGTALLQLRTARIFEPCLLPTMVTAVAML